MIYVSGVLTLNHYFCPATSVRPVVSVLIPSPTYRDTAVILWSQTEAEKNQNKKKSQSYWYSK